MVFITALLDIIKAPAKYQYSSSTIVSLGTFICGLIIGWSSSAVATLKSDETPLKNRSITADELSWIASISNIGGFLGTFCFVYLADKFGRKKMLFVIAVPSLVLSHAHIISFLIVVWADNVYELYASRFLGGLASGGSYMIAPLYIMEISECKIRGYLTSKIQLFYNLGVCCAFLIGNYCSYKTTAIVYCTVPVIYGALTLFLPESPFYLMKTGRHDEALDTFRYFRGITEDPPFSSVTCQREWVEVEKHKNDLADQANMKLSDFLTYTSVKAQSLAIVLALMNQLSGVTAFLSYTQSIFTESGSNISPKISSLIIAVVSMIGTITGVSLIEHAGRKKLMVWCSLGCSIVLIVFGISDLARTNYGYQSANILPIIYFAGHMFIGSCGPFNLPYVIIPEILPNKIRSITLAYITAFTWIFGFLTVKYFYIIAFTYGMYICLLIFAASLLFGSVILMVVLPETQGKRFSQIQCSLSKDGS